MLIDTKKLPAENTNGGARKKQKVQKAQMSSKSKQALMVAKEEV